MPHTEKSQPPDLERVYSCNVCHLQPQEAQASITEGKQNFLVVIPMTEAEGEGST